MRPPTKHLGKRSGKTVAVTALASALAVVGTGWYLVSPPQTALAVEVATVMTTRVAAGHELVFGTVRDSKGAPVPRAAVTIGHRVGNRFVTDVALKTAGDGTFRKSLALAAGAYLIKVVSKVGGKTLTTTHAIKLTPGRAYSVTVKQLRKGGLTIVPVRGY
jgi:hypothetical protein